METAKKYLDMLNDKPKKKKIPYSSFTEEHKQKLRERSKMYRQKNSEVYKQKQRELYYKNKDKRLEYQLQYDRNKRTEFLEKKKTETETETETN